MEEYMHSRFGYLRLMDFADEISESDKRKIVDGLLDMGTIEALFIMEEVGVEGLPINELVESSSQIRTAFINYAFRELEIDYDEIIDDFWD